MWYSGPGTSRYRGMDSSPPDKDDRLESIPRLIFTARKQDRKDRNSTLNILPHSLLFMKTLALLPFSKMITLSSRMITFIFPEKANHSASKLNWSFQEYLSSVEQLTFNPYSYVFFSLQDRTVKLERNEAQRQICQPQ